MMKIGDRVRTWQYKGGKVIIGVITGVNTDFKTPFYVIHPDYYCEGVDISRLEPEVELYETPLEKLVKRLNNGKVA